MENMIKILSENEKKVLYGLVRYPDLPDTEIHKRIGVKRSTYALHKKKLMENGYYSTVRVPILQHLGCTFLIVSYLTLNRKKTLKDRLAVSNKYLGEFPEEFFVVSEANHAINIAIAKNMTEFERNFEQFIQVFEDNDLLAEERITTIRFPFDLTRVLSFFEFAPLLHRTFELDLNDDAVDLEVNFEKTQCVVKNRELSELEKSIYYALIKYPELSDSGLAGKVKCTRQSITKAKERFYDEALIKTKRIINLEKLGFGILAFTHSKCNPRKSMAERRECIIRISKIKMPIFHLSKNFDRISITPFMNFKDYHDIHERATNFCSINDIITEEPKTILLSIPRMTMIKNHLYAPIVKKILATKTFFNQSSAEKI